jgi:hypothetical protein
MLLPSFAFFQTEFRGFNSACEPQHALLHLFIIKWLLTQLVIVSIPSFIYLRLPFLKLLLSSHLHFRLFPSFLCLHGLYLLLLQLLMELLLYLIDISTFECLNDLLSLFIIFYIFKEHLSLNWIHLLNYANLFLKL